MPAVSSVLCDGKSVRGAELKDKVKKKKKKKKLKCEDLEKEVKRFFWGEEVT